MDLLSSSKEGGNMYPMEHMQRVKEIKPSKVNHIKPTNENRIKLLACSRSKKETKWAPDNHSHPYFEFIYFFNAKAQIDLPDGQFNLVPFDVVVYPPGIMHHEFPDLQYSQEILCIAAYIEGLNQWNSSFHISDTNGILGWLFEQCYKEYKEKQENYEEVIINYIQAIITHINRNLNASKKQTIDIINSCIRFIHEHYQESISMEQLASISCVSKSYLSRLFLKKTGMSPLRYLNYIRIDVSKKLLMDSKLSIRDIAAKVGFNDPLYFSRVFKKISGVAPIEYRSNFHGKENSVH